MNLYVFKPSKHWDYVGGGLVILAKNFESSCQAMRFTDPDAELFIEELSLAPDHAHDKWVLVEKIYTPHERKERVVLYSYNYS